MLVYRRISVVLFVVVSTSRQIVSRKSHSLFQLFYSREVESTPLTWPCGGPITDVMDWATHPNMELEGWATRALPPPKDDAGRATEDADADEDAFIGAAPPEGDDPMSQSVQEEFCSATAAAWRCRRRSVRTSSFRYSSRCSSSAILESFSIWAARKSSPPEPEASDGDGGKSVSGVDPTLSNSATTWATAAALRCSKARAAELMVAVVMGLFGLLFESFRIVGGSTLWFVL